jgi:hypothetical protein
MLEAPIHENGLPLSQVIFLFGFMGESPKCLAKACDYKDTERRQKKKKKGHYK